MRIRLFMCGAAGLLLAGVAASGGAVPRNPVLIGADPHIAILCDRYWIYPSNALDPVNGFAADRFYGYASRDLRTWTRSAPLIDIGAIRWVRADGAPAHYLWAPAVIQANGRFYLYYSVGPQDPTPSRIGVAVGSRPGGPFRDSGKPLLAGGNGFEAIDPMVFIDPPTKTPYLYAGGSAGATLRVFQLTPDMVSIAREIPVRTPPLFTEGAFMHARNGTYYLSYSHGRWNDATYSAHYATAPSPTGPWSYRGAILSSDGTHKGPGHHSIIRDPHSGRWFIAYHRWDRTNPTGPFSGMRVTAVQRLTYSADGRILPIRMTDAAPTGSPLSRSPQPGCRD